MKIRSHITAAALLSTLNFSANAGAKEAEAVIPQGQNSVYNLNIDWKYKRLQTASR